MKLKKSTINNLISYGIVIVAFVAVQLLQNAGLVSRSLRGQLVPICVYIVMAVSLNLTVGISGELSLGHAGFMSVGVFSGVVFSQWMTSLIAMRYDAAVAAQQETLILVVSMFVGGLFAGLAGVIIGIPVLRLRGDYLAIVTLAFGEIIRNVINCLYISIDNGRVHIAFDNPNVAGEIIVNGPAGTRGVDRISTFVIGFALVLFTLFVVLNLINSRSGRAIMACRDSRIAAESVGINVPHDGLCHLGVPGRHGRRALRVEHDLGAVLALQFRYVHPRAGVRGAGRHRQYLGLNYCRHAAYGVA